MTGFSKRFACGWAGVALMLTVAAFNPAEADSITFGGETWNDVLIYKSSTMYYVKVPENGTIFNVPIDAVPPSNVHIVNDPWYRDELKKRFDQNAAPGSRASSDSVGTSVFNVGVVGEENGTDNGAPPLEDMPADAQAPADAGADSMKQVTAMLRAMQFKVAPQDGDVVATSPDGSTTITFVGGSPEGGVRYAANVPETAVQTQMIAINALGNLTGETAPWARDFLQQEVAPLLQTGGSAEKSEGPVTIAAEVTKSGGNVSVNITATPNAAT